MLVVMALLYIHRDQNSVQGFLQRQSPTDFLTDSLLAQGVQKTREVDSSEREQPRRRTQWGVANPVQQATNPTSVNPKLANSSSTAGLISNKPAIEPSSQPSMPHEYAAR